MVSNTKNGWYIGLYVILVLFFGLLNCYVRVLDIIGIPVFFKGVVLASVWWL